MSEVLAFTDDTLRKALENRKLPILLVFSAPWSQANKVMEPLIREIAGDYAKKLDIGIMNIDENAHLPAELGIKSIPHVTLFDTNGKILTHLTGPQPKSKIVELIEKNLNINIGR